MDTGGLAIMSLASLPSPVKARLGPGPSQLPFYENCNNKKNTHVCCLRLSLSRFLLYSNFYPENLSIPMPVPSWSVVGGWKEVE